jgi:hypothetical protein
MTRRKRGDEGSICPLADGICAPAGIVSEDRLDLPEARLPLSLLSDPMAQVSCDLLTFSSQDTHRREGQQMTRRDR